MDQSVRDVGMTAEVVKRSSNKPELRVKVRSDRRESLKVLTSEDVFFFQYFVFFVGFGGGAGCGGLDGVCVAFSE